MPSAARSPSVPDDVLARLLRQELARRHLWEYCKWKDGRIYHDGHPYLRELCDALEQAVVTPGFSVTTVSAPPRHGKSYTAQCLAEWILGHDPTAKVMTASYNKQLSTVFAQAVRNTISAQKADADIDVYADIFPGTRIKEGEASKFLWAVEGSTVYSYLATSPNGTATGFGCTYLIIDDLIKSDYEASNDLVKDGLWTWFIDTALSRLEEGGKIVCIGTRWATDDPIGRIERHFADLGYPVRSLVYRALQDDGTMLAPDILSRDTYDMKRQTMSEDTFRANYQQEPIDIIGRLYTSFRLYDPSQPLPDLISVRAYVDVADAGGDYLCAVVYGETQTHQGYLLDVLYTQEGTEQTEAQVADLLLRYHVGWADIESNNGGGIFARNVYAIVNRGQVRTQINAFHQTNNKQTRMIANAWWVQNNLWFPEDWGQRWPSYETAMTRFLRDGRNQHDDAPDATTGVAERLQQTGSPVRVTLTREPGRQAHPEVRRFSVRRTF